MKYLIKLIPAIFFVSIIIFNTGCKKEEDTPPATTDYAIKAADFGNLSITLTEDSGVANTWIFTTTGASGTAEFQGQGNHSYTYEVTGENKSTLIFDVDGDDKYEMTWTSETGGTIKEYFNGTFGSDGTFSITLN